MKTPHDILAPWKYCNADCAESPAHLHSTVCAQLTRIATTSKPAGELVADMSGEFGEAYRVEFGSYPSKRLVDFINRRLAPYASAGQEAPSSAREGMEPVSPSPSTSPASPLTCGTCGGRRQVAAKCSGCIHPAHLGDCSGRNGGTAYRCVCFRMTPIKTWEPCPDCTEMT